MIKGRFSNTIRLQLIRRLPSLMNDIERKLQVVQEALDSLPQSFADNPQGKLLNLCAEFNACIKEYTIGSESYPDFFEDLYDEFEKLAKEITSTRPKFEIPQKTAQKGASAIAALRSQTARTASGLSLYPIDSSFRK